MMGIATRGEAVRTVHRKIRRGLQMASAVLACSAALATERIDILASEYPPICQDSPGPEKGLAIDLMMAAFQAVDVDVELHFFPVPRMVHFIETAQAMCAVGGRVLFEEPSVASTLRMGSAIHHVTQTFLYDRRRFPEGITYASLDKLKGLPIGVLQSSSIASYLQKEGLQLVPASSHENSARQLQSGEIALWAIVDVTGYLTLKKMFGDEADQFGRTKGFNRGDISLVCSRERDVNGAYVRKFADGLARIKKNGIYRQIMGKYYGGEQRINREALGEEPR